MYDAVAMDMAQSIQYLAEETPGDINIIVQAICYQITEGLGCR